MNETTKSVVQDPPDVSDLAKNLALVRMLQEVVQRFTFKPSEEAIVNMLTAIGYENYQDWASKLNQLADKNWQRMNAEWLANNN